MQRKGAKKPGSEKKSAAHGAAPPASAQVTANPASPPPPLPPRTHHEHHEQITVVGNAALVPLFIVYSCLAVILYLSRPYPHQWAPPLDHGADFNAFLWHVPPAVSEYQGTGHLVQSFADAVQKYSRVSVHGPAGAGASQLAVQYARATAGNYSVVIWLSAGSKEAVTAQLFTLSTDLGFRLASQEREVVLDAVVGWLYSRNLPYLLVFDDCADTASTEDFSQFIPRTYGHVIFTSHNAISSVHSFPVGKKQAQHELPYAKILAAAQHRLTDCPATPESGLAGSLTTIADHLRQQRPEVYKMLMISCLQDGGHFPARLLYTWGTNFAPQISVSEGISVLSDLSLMQEGGYESDFIYGSVLLKPWLHVPRCVCDVINPTRRGKNADSKPAEKNVLRQSAVELVLTLPHLMTEQFSMYWLVDVPPQTPVTPPAQDAGAAPLAPPALSAYLQSLSWSGRLFERAVLSAAPFTMQSSPRSWGLRHPMVEWPAPGNFGDDDHIRRLAADFGSALGPFTYSFVHAANGILAADSAVADGDKSSVELQPLTPGIVASVLRFGARLLLAKVADRASAKTVAQAAVVQSQAYYKMFGSATPPFVDQPAYDKLSAAQKTLFANISVQESLLHVSAAALNLDQTVLARDLMVDVLNEDTKFYGEKHPIIAGDHLRFGQFFSKVSDHAQARQHFEAAYNSDKDLLSTGHSKVASDLVEWARFDEKVAENLEQARLHSQMALDVEAYIHGDGNLAVAERLHDVARILDLQDQSKAALPLHQRAFSIRKMTLDSLDPLLAQSFAFVAVGLKAVGRVGNARSHLQSAADIELDGSSPNSLLVANRFSQVGDVVFFYQSYDEALRNYYRVFEIYRRRDGEEAASTREWFFKCRKVQNLIQQAQEEKARKQAAQAAQAAAAAAQQAQAAAGKKP